MKINLRTDDVLKNEISKEKINNLIHRESVTADMLSRLNTNLEILEHFPTAIKVNKKKIFFQKLIKNSKYQNYSYIFNDLEGEEKFL